MKTLFQGLTITLLKIIKRIKNKIIKILQKKIVHKVITKKQQKISKSFISITINQITNLLTIHNQNTSIKQKKNPNKTPITHMVIKNKDKIKKQNKNINVILKPKKISLKQESIILIFKFINN